MEILQFPSGPLDTNAYILGDPLTRLAYVLDPAPGSYSHLTSALESRSWTPLAILLTHSHWDHFGDLVSLKKRWAVPVYIHSLDVENIRHPGADGVPLLFPIKGLEPDHLLEEGAELYLGDVLIKVLSLPGHTPGGVGFYLPEKKVLFSGDTLFRGSIGTLSLPTARPEQMWLSLKRLANLPGDVKVFPGHGPSTTILQEKWIENAKNYFR